MEYTKTPTVLPTETQEQLTKRLITAVELNTKEVADMHGTLCEVLRELMEMRRGI